MTLCNSIARRISAAAGITACLVLLMGICAVFTSAYASDTTINLSGQKSDIECTDPKTEYHISGTADHDVTIRIKGGCKDSPIVVVLDSVKIDQSSFNPDNAPITIEENTWAVVKLSGTNTLAGGNHNKTGHDTGIAGIDVNKSSFLTVTSAQGDGSTDGSLTAKGGDKGTYGGAGIGSNNDSDGGVITIAGGTISATGGACAAGIGTGRDGVCNGIIIKGGKVTAKGQQGAAGIGAGKTAGSGDGGNCKTINITGGTIVAYGGENAAGIGGSEDGTVD